MRRDRSIRGQEVVVGIGRSVVAQDKAMANQNNLLGLLDSSLSSAPRILTNVSDEVSKNWAWVGERLPPFWPSTVPKQIATMNRQEYQIEANKLL